MPFFRKGHRDPFREIEDLFGDDFFGFFPGMRKHAPAADVYQTDENVVVEMQIPHVDPQNVDIEVEDNVLTVSGGEEEIREEKDKNYYRREIRHGAFHRSIQLPVRVKGEKAEADYSKGILKITLPKAEESKSKRIEIKTGDT